MWCICAWGFYSALSCHMALYTCFVLMCVTRYMLKWRLDTSCSCVLLNAKHVALGRPASLNHGYGWVLAACVLRGGDCIWL